MTLVLQVHAAAECGFPTGHRRSAPAAVLTQLQSSGPLLFLNDANRLPATFRPSLLCAIETHPCQVKAAALAITPECDPGDLVPPTDLPTSTQSTAAASGATTSAIASYETSGMSQSIVASAGTGGMYGVDGGLSVSRGLGVDGVGVRLRASDVLPGTKYIFQHAMILCVTVTCCLR